MIHFCRGPLPAGSLCGGVIVSGPDSDIPWQASGLPVVPKVTPLPARVPAGQVLLYLEAHRGPDEALARLQAMASNGVRVIVQGDPLAWRPARCQALAAALEQQPMPTRSLPPMNYFATIREAVNAGIGEMRVLAGSIESLKATHAHLRGDEQTVVAGDPVYHFRSSTRARVMSPEHVQLTKGCRTPVVLDDGRKVEAGHLWPCLVEILSSTWGSGECDSLVLLPDVGTGQAWCAMQRVRRQIIGVGWHPCAYVPE